MEINKEQQREEIILCMIEQDYFNFGAYQEEMDKLKQVYNFPSIYKEILKEQIHNIIRDKIDSVIEGNSL